MSVATAALGGEVVEAQHDADRDRLQVGVHEAAAADALGAVADDRARRALVAGQVEAVLDGLAGQRDDGLDADREVVQRLLLAQPDLLGDERVDPVGRDDDVRAQLVVAGLDADDPRPGPPVISVSTRSTRTPGMTKTPASSHFSASHASSLARSTVTALTGSASRASL